jgi:hypothetical protein
MTQSLGKIVLVSLMVVGLAACKKDRKVQPQPPEPPPPAQPQALEDKFGANFGTTFRANKDSEPRDPADGDIIPVNSTAEPIDF